MTNGIFYTAKDFDDCFMGLKLYGIVKRLFDIGVSAVSLMLLSPVLLLIALIVTLDSPGGALFQQKRVGKNKAYFQIFKFRTMYKNAPSDVPTHMVTSSAKLITKPGKFLRKTSLDELPQLINILRGDMSLVGPRPALYNQYDLIAERDLYGANDIRPGLTGLAQIRGRDELSIPVKAKFDGEYVKTMSIRTDLCILFRTALSVFRHEGVRDNA